MNYKEQIKAIGKNNNGYITYSAVKKSNIPTVYLSRLEKEKLVTRLRAGIYLLNGFPEDEFYTYSLCYSHLVFARRTALYLNGLTNRQLEIMEGNFPLNQNTAKIFGLKCYRVNETIYSLGTVEIPTPFGNTVRTYNKERCICNLFMYDDFDNEEKSFAVNAYKKSGIDFDLLFSYAEALGVYTQIKSIFEVI